MITYLQLIHCHWIRVTTTIEVWARLPHVARAVVVCGFTAAMVVPPLPVVTLPTLDENYDYSPEATFIPGIDFDKVKADAPLVPPADTVMVDEPGSLGVLALGLAALLVVRRRSAP